MFMHLEGLAQPNLCVATKSTDIKTNQLPPKLKARSSVEWNLLKCTGRYTLLYILDPSPIRTKTSLRWVNFLMLVDHADEVRRLRTATTNGPIVHPPGDMWAWRAVVVIIPAGKNSWLVHQSSLATYQQRHLGASTRNGRIFNLPKILRPYFPSSADFYRP
jgi:hypothetical protein